jgi:acylpyruvate hydrolase
LINPFVFVKIFIFYKGMDMIRNRENSEEITVGSIFCLGQNYPLHAREMKSDVPTAPVIFMKPATAICRNGDPVRIPPISLEVHHEVELIVAIGKGGRDIPQSEAFSHVLGYAVGLDMTLRDVQAEAKKKGHPWTVAKGFDTSAPISDILPPSAIGNPHSLTLRCSVNGSVRQEGSTADMVFSIDKIISYLSSIFTLRRGDLIFTGTPAGVGPVKPGDTIEAEIAGIVRITHPVEQA